MDEIAGQEDEEKKKKGMALWIYALGLAQWEEVRVDAGIILNYGDVIELIPPIKTSELYYFEEDEDESGFFGGLFGGTKTDTGQTKNYATQGNTMTGTPDFQTTRGGHTASGTTVGNQAKRLDMKRSKIYNWTIMCRIYCPFTKSNDDHVLLQSEDGLMTFFFISGDLSYYGVREDEDEEYVAKIKTKISTGWHHLCLIYKDNMLKVFLDFKELDRQIDQPINFWKPIKFVGNSCTGANPFGVISDFR